MGLLSGVEELYRKTMGEASLRILGWPRQDQAKEKNANELTIGEQAREIASSIRGLNYPGIPWELDPSLPATGAIHTSQWREFNEKGIGSKLFEARLTFDRPTFEPEEAERGLVFAGSRAITGYEATSVGRGGNCKVELDLNQRLTSIQLSGDLVPNRGQSSGVVVDSARMTDFAGDPQLEAAVAESRIKEEWKDLMQLGVPTVGGISYTERQVQDGEGAEIDEITVVVDSWQSENPAIVFGDAMIIVAKPTEEGEFEFYRRVYDKDENNNGHTDIPLDDEANKDLLVEQGTGRKLEFRSFTADPKNGSVVTITYSDVDHGELNKLEIGLPVIPFNEFMKNTQANVGLLAAKVQPN